MIDIQNELKIHSGKCAVGFLAIGGVRHPAEDALAHEKIAVASALREAYGSMTRSAMKELHPMNAYIEYYRKFGYSYHVLGQLESVLKGKPIPGTLPLVTAMFMAELKNMMLTAAHDLDKIEGSLQIAQATGHETYETIGAHLAETVAGDVMVRDRRAILSSILRGPDRRTAITAETGRVLYVVYAPQGVMESLVRRHLDDIERCVLLACEAAAVEGREVFL